jgi:hypothetical protein
MEEECLVTQRTTIPLRNGKTINVIKRLFNNKQVFVIARLVRAIQKSLKKLDSPNKLGNDRLR